jgi:hypothetical protein
MPRFTIFQQRLEKINGDLYIVKAEYGEDRIKNITAVREWLGCTNAFRVHSNRSIIFCDLIEEIKPI